MYPDGAGNDQKNSQDVKTEFHQAQFVAEKVYGSHLGHDRRYPVKYAESHGNQNNAVKECEFFLSIFDLQPFQFFELVFKRLAHGFQFTGFLFQFLERVSTRASRSASCLEKV